MRTVLTLFFVAFGLLQTQPGKALAAAAIARVASSPDSEWAIEGLGGTFPFDMTARRITVSDPDGVWLTLKDVRLDIDLAALFAGELHVPVLHAAEIYKARPAAGPSLSLVEYLRVPHLPIALVLDRLEIDRLILGPPILGARIIATVAGDVAVRGAAARADLDIHRIDGSVGKIGLQMTMAGAQPKLSLRLHADDPTGVVGNRIFGRTDHLPLALSIDGDGPVSDWRGRLVASAGPHARLDADFALAVSKETALTLSARAAVASLLPANFAPLVGDDAGLALHAIFGQRIIVDRLSFAAASGTLAGDGAFGGPGEPVAAHLHADLPDLSRFATITGGNPHGLAAMTAELSGSKSRPAVKVEFSAAQVEVFGSAARSLIAQVSATPTAALDDPHPRFAVDGRGQLTGLALPQGSAFAAHIGEKIVWSLAAIVDRDARAVALAHLGVNGGGIDLNGSGHLAAAANGIAGTLNVTGSATGLRTNVAAADVLLGPTPSFAATFRRDEVGIVTVDGLALTGAAAKLAGDARFEPASNNLTAALAIDIPRLESLRPAIGTDISGSLSAKATAQGPLDRLQLRTEIGAHGIATRNASIDQLKLAATVADLSKPEAAVDGSFRAGRLDGRLALTAAPIENTGLSISNLRLTAADSSIAGDLRIAFAGGLIQGSLAGRFPDLSRWSALAGKPLAGSVELSAGMTSARGGQDLDLDIKGARLIVGTGASSIAIGRLAATARLTDLWRQPIGTGRAALNTVHSGSFDFSAGTATFTSRRPGRFAFQGNAAGHPLSLVLAGEAGLAPSGGNLRLARLAGSLDHENFALEQPLDVQRRGSDLVVSRLALRFGSGRITGSGSLRGEALALDLNASDLSIAAGARLSGHPNIQGNLSLAATLGGNLRAPRGRFTINAAGLALAASRHAQTPRLGLTVEGDWDGRAVDLHGQVTGLHGDRMALTGSVPLLLTPAPFGIAVPPQGRLAINLQGGGNIGHLADLLPLGEDRLSGEFAVDASVAGTIAALSASGRVRLSGARYESFASGAVLTNLDAELVGIGDRFQLASLSAGDGSGGSLKAQGSLALKGPEGTTAQLSATIANFRVAARDEALATTSGTLFVTGPLTAPKVSARLTVDNAEINLPSSLPQSVVVIKVTEINGRKGRPPAPVASAAALAATLDITINLPGQVLVRGHGLDSNWHGHLAITGTTTAPKIAGALIASRGSVDLLGKSFRLTRGAIAFDGSAKLDPALDIVAEASASDITARVIINGFASAPKITLASTPPVPQDEILSRLLFNQGVGQLTAGQGLQLAAAASTLAGGGPDVLDRLRGKLGLDWLSFGQGPAGAASSILNPSVVTPTKQGTTAVSAGKYIAPGVSIGVTQGVSPPTSKVTVEVDLGHHVTVDTEAGQNNGTGIGLSYNYDY